MMSGCMTRGLYDEGVYDKGGIGCKTNGVHDKWDVRKVRCMTNGVAHLRNKYAT